jgi:histidyl-tRNA synthetase
MAISTTPYKGTRDFYPEDFRVRQYIFDTWVKTCLQFGYEQYDASIVESLELYQAKTSEEIVSEQTYAFEDRGGRAVTLRPEMTPTVSRMIAARRQELAYPVRWFSIPNVWRYERPQRGRLREHWQLNVDVFGIDNSSADYEVIALVDAIMQSFGAKRDMYTIRLNSRKLINYIMADYLQLDEAEATTIIRLIDRKDKIEYAEFSALVSASISPSQREEHATDEKLLELLSITSLDQLPSDIAQHQSVQTLRDLVKLLSSQGITNVQFDLSLMRGFMYYTDVVFEMVDTNPVNNRSMFGGGRYDGLVGQFGVEPLPTVGFGMGDVTIRDFLETHKLLPKLTTSVQATVILVDATLADAMPLVNRMRQEGAKISVDSTDRKLEKKLKSVAKNAVPYAILLGKEELESNQITLKDMRRGTQEKHSEERIVATIMAITDPVMLD